MLSAHPTKSAHSLPPVYSLRLQTTPDPCPGKHFKQNFRTCPHQTTCRTQYFLLSSVNIWWAIVKSSWFSPSFLFSLKRREFSPGSPEGKLTSLIQLSHIFHKTSPFQLSSWCFSVSVLPHLPSSRHRSLRVRFPHLQVPFLIPLVEIEYVFVDLVLFRSSVCSACCKWLRISQTELWFKR